MRVLSAARYLAVALAGSVLLAQPLRAEVSSAYYTRWKNGLTRYLTTPNEFVAQRALADLSESGPQLPEKERAAAIRFLQVAMRQGQMQNPAGFQAVFAPGFDARRAVLFKELDKLPWSGGVTAVLNDLLDDMAAQASKYNPATLSYDALVEECRARQIGADRVARIVEAFGISDEGFLAALCFAHRARPADGSRWTGLFDARFGTVREGGRLADTFGRLDHDTWKKAAEVRQAYRRRLADWLFETPPPSWTALHPDRFFDMVKAGSQPIEEWELRLVKSVAVSPDARARETLNQLTRRHGYPETSYTRIGPWLAEQQDVFCFLHEPPGGVMDYWNSLPANMEKSRRVLNAFLAPSRESQWNACLESLLRRYYASADPSGREDLYQKTIRPILHARLAPDFVPERGRQALRKALTDQLLAQPSFLQPAHLRDAVLPFMEKLDWSAEIQAGEQALPNYRFVARALVALGSTQGGSKGSATVHVADLARWVDWMVEGMIKDPARLNMGVDMAADSLREICAEWRRLKNLHGISTDSATLRGLFANLERELNQAAAEAQSGEAAVTPEEPPVRLVRAIRLALVISSLIEEEQLLPLILDTMREKLFAVGSRPDGAPRILTLAAMQQQVNLFLALDGDIAACLLELVNAPGATDGMRDILRSFARRYHMEVQLPLLNTDRFLGLLLEKDGALTPFRRYLATRSGAHPCALDAEGLRMSRDILTNTLARAGFLNSEEGVAALLGIYRDALGASLWRTPEVFGHNDNVNLPVLLRLLRDEDPPAADAGSTETVKADPQGWNAPVYLPVLAFMLGHLSADPAAAPIRSVEYDRQGKAVRKDRYESIRFIRSADLLLRAQEMLSFPITTPAGAIPPGEHAIALAQAALSDSDAATLPGFTLPADSQAVRRIDGRRRAGLCAALASSPPTQLKDAVAVARCALMLPNGPVNAVETSPLPEYDRHREWAYRLLAERIAAEPSSGSASDALITMLRLDACRRGQGKAGDSKEFIARNSTSLPPAGRWRLLLELWAQSRRMTGDVVRVEACAEHDPPSSECRRCRDAVAQRLSARVAELEDVRRFCLDQAGISVSAAPTNEWQVIAQLARCVRRMDQAAAEIDAIGPDAAKATWYLASQIKRAIQCIPPAWSGNWMDQLDVREPLTEGLVKLSVFSVAAYSDVFPVFGDVALPDLLGDGQRPANGDALAVFSVLDAEVKKFLLSVAPLEDRVEKSTGIELKAIDSPSTRELVAVHSAVQPLLVSGIWTQGAQSVRGGGSLLQFVVDGRQYDESYFDIDLVYEVGGSFTLSPRLIFDEAFRAIDLLVECAGGEVGDRFVYDAWYGDLRTTMAENGMRGREKFNLDLFLCRAADIAEDRRYEAAGMEAVRPFAEAFRRELNGWVRGDGTAALGGLLQRAQSPAIFPAVAGRMGDRLGLIRPPDDPDALAPLTGDRLAVYAGFCRKALFDTTGGRPVFPRPLRSSQCERFSVTVPTTNELEAGRIRFADLFDAAVPAGDGNSSRLDTLVALYRRSTAPAVDEFASRFVGDFSYAYLHLASEMYWAGALDRPDQPRETNRVAVSYPWRMDTNGQAYIDAAMPGDGETSGPLHTDAIRANIEWRAAAADRFRAVPCLCRFFGGDSSTGRAPEGETP